MSDFKKDWRDAAQSSMKKQHFRDFYQMSDEDKNTERVKMVLRDLADESPEARKKAKELWERTLTDSPKERQKLLDAVKRLRGREEE